jgi:hypothetical protein
MSEFAREAVLTSVLAGSGGKTSLGGDLVTLTSRLQELARQLKSADALIEKVLGTERHSEQHGETGGGGA